MENCIKELKATSRSLRDLFFPRRCIVCGKALDTAEEDICLDCFSDLPMTHFWDWTQNEAYERIVTKASVEAAASLFRFRKESDYRSILYGIKYNNRRTLGYRMGYLLGRRLATSASFNEVQVVVPVPLHPLRRWKRGYNQAEIIARGIADAMGLPIETGLVRRSRRTRTQTRLSVEEKARNVKGAFTISKKCAQNLTDEGISHLLLVDDVLTTGATLAECAKPLLPTFKVSIASLAFVS